MTALPPRADYTRGFADPARLLQALPVNRPTPALSSVRFPLRSLALALLLCASLGGAVAQTAPAAAAPAASAASGPTLRAEVAKPLVAAQEAVKAGQYQEALARVAEAEAIPALTPYEQYIVLRLKAPAALGLGGDQPGLLAIFEQLLASPLLPAGEKPPFVETAIKLALNQKQYEKAGALMKGYLADGGSNAEIARLYPQVLALVGDHAGVIARLQPQLAADEAAKRTTPEVTLRLLAGSQLELKDLSGYLVTLEKLASTTGKPDYWGELITRTARRNGFAEERLMLDVYRLRQAVGITLLADEVGDMAFRANQAGLPAEAQKLLDAGYASGLLGKGANAAADQKLREAATKAANQDRASAADSEAAAMKGKDGNAAYGLGLALSATGAHDRALALMNHGLSKGGLRRPDDAQLHLGVAQWRAGKFDEARASFAAVKGSDGAADLARLWTVYLNSPARK